MRTLQSIRCLAILSGMLLWISLSSTSAAPAPESSFQVAIDIDASKSQGELKPIWRFFGADEPNYAYMRDGRKLLGELGKLGPKTTYFRAHSLLVSGDGTPALKWGSTGAYREDAQGRPIYDWTIVDRIFDTYLKSGMKPYVQIGFMPRELSTKPDPYQHHWTPKAKYDEIYTGWAYPPKDYAQWGELVYQWARHCVAKYGRAEVETWYWEVWNEPNIGYWRGTQQEFFKLHDHAVTAVRRAIPTARVGGPEVAGGPGGQFLRNFLEHCLRGTNEATRTVGTPLDFIAFHAKGAPRFVEGHVEMGIANQLRDIDAAFAVVASFPELKRTPIVIGESDPDGCAACQGPQLGYRNGTMYSSYTAASFARKHALAAKHGVNLEGALTWAFEFEDQPLFAGFRVLASNGIDLPVLNVFRMFSTMKGQRLAVESSAGQTLDSIVKQGVRSTPDVSALASMDRNKLCVMLWHYHDADLPGPEAQVQLSLAGLPTRASSAVLKHFRIDADHSNAFEVWKRMGSPATPSAIQLKQLEQAGQLAAMTGPGKLDIRDGKAQLRVTLPRQAVSLVTIEWTATR